MDHLRMNGAYWGLTTLDLLDKLPSVSVDEVVSWLITCQHESGLYYLLYFCLPIEQRLGTERRCLWNSYCLSLLNMLVKSYMDTIGLNIGFFTFVFILIIRYHSVKKLTNGDFLNRWLCRKYWTWPPCFIYTECCTNLGPLWQTRHSWRCKSIKLYPLALTFFTNGVNFHITTMQIFYDRYHCGFLYTIY